MARRASASKAASSFDRYLRHAANKSGLSISELAQRANISRETLYDILNGNTREPSVFILTELARILRKAPADLVRRAYGRAGLPTFAHKDALIPGDHSSFV